jgi:hypothetical protein
MALKYAVGYLAGAAAGLGAIALKMRADGVAGTPMAWPITTGGILGMLLAHQIPTRRRKR